MIRLPLIGLAGRPGAGTRTAVQILRDVHAFAELGPDKIAQARGLLDTLIAHFQRVADRHHYSGVVLYPVTDDALADWLRARDGCVWHLVRHVPGPPGSGIAPQAGDRTLDNTGSPDALAAAIDYLLHGDHAHVQR